MTVIRNVFHLKFGKTREAVALMKFFSAAGGIAARIGAGVVQCLKQSVTGRYSRWRFSRHCRLEPAR